MTKTANSPGELLAFLFSSWPEIKKSKVRSWLKHQSVLVNGEPVTQFNHLLDPGDVIGIRTVRYAAPRTPLSSGIKAWFEDSHVIVIDKPPDLLSIASNDEDEKTAYFLLTDYLRGNRPKARERVWIVHRLDKETSGLMVFAKTPEAKEFLQSHWEAVEKHYEAVVEGHLKNHEGVFECDLDERSRFKVLVSRPSEHTRHAITRYRVLSENPRRSLVQLRLETGRRHQIRVQLAAAGCPIIGDKKYEAQSDPAGRLGLHATFLQFPHPATGAEMRFSSPLPKSLAAHVPPKPKEDRNPQEKPSHDRLRDQS
ncbi:MAG: RluA family pseudouridine synthase [Verrucomicrobiae bacterium]